MKNPIPIIGDFTEQEKLTWLSALHKAMPKEQFVTLDSLPSEERVPIDFAIVANPNPVELKTLPNLVWVQSLWAGVEKLVAHFADAPFKIVRLTDPALANTMAEAALTWTLFLHRDMHQYRTFQRKKQWQPLEYKPPEQRTVGILGLGLLGARCSELLVAQGFHVIGWSNSAKNLKGVTSYTGADELNTVFKQSDIIINLLPSTPDTHHLFNKETFEVCSNDLKLINFGRGHVIDDTALLSALEQGKVSYAVLDVFDLEPLPSDHPFWHHPNITVLPHISAPTRPDTACQVVRDNLIKYRADGTLPATVDFKRGY